MKRRGSGGSRVSLVCPNLPILFAESCNAGTSCLADTSPQPFMSARAMPAGEGQSDLWISLRYLHHRCAEYSAMMRSRICSGVSFSSF